MDHRFAHTVRRVAALAAGLLLSLASAAQSLQDTRITGTFFGVTSEGSVGEGSYECKGEPTCVGSYKARIRDHDCSNSFEFSGAFRLTGADLSRTGLITVVATLEHFGSERRVEANGTCAYQSSQDTENMPMSGLWDGTTATLAGEFDDFDEMSGKPTHVVITSTFTATRSAPPPVFPMTVNANITPTVASADAQLQFRAQDVGSNPNVYVFAVAPANLVRNGTLMKAAQVGWTARGRTLADPVQCVLAQLTANGQLAAVSVSSIQAALGAVVTSQGAAVQILNNVATPSVAGATFFVGYGSSAANMVNNGVNRSAVTVPGSQLCQPQPPTTGWWWNGAEPGRGFSVEVRDNKVFFAAFLYDTSGRATWYVATGPASMDGSYYSGPLYAARGGQTLGGPYLGGPSLDTVGTITLAFNSATNGTMVWPGGTVPLQRFDIVQGGAAMVPSGEQPENGWWWNPDESGRGFFMEWQGGTLDIAGYMYDDQGNPVWYLGWEPMAPGSMNLAGNWMSFADGQTLNGAWKANRLVTDHLAPVTVRFTSRSTAVMTLPNGRTTNLVRHRF